MDEKTEKELEHLHNSCRHPNYQREKKLVGECNHGHARMIQGVCLDCNQTFGELRDLIQKTRTECEKEKDEKLQVRAFALGQEKVFTNLIEKIETMIKQTNNFHEIDAYKKVFALIKEMK